MEILRAVKGMNDLFYPDILTWQKIEKLTAEIFTVYGYQEIRTPIVEDLNLFVRGVGENTDIVEKEMYVLKDRNEKMLALRPEGTASVVRSLLEKNKLGFDAEFKCYYVGPMFRRERPQKGRLRQFHQMGAEFFGVANPSADIEVIAMIYDLLQTLGLSNLKLMLNTLGENQERKKYAQALHVYFSACKDKLCSDCQRRLEKNTLRILDCKNPECISLAKGAPQIAKFLSKESSEHFEEVKKGLTQLKIPFEISQSLVRGLDYYTKTVFEIVALDGLGSQNAVAAGGRYDGLVENLGGKPVSAFGFAAGIERIVLLLQEEEELKKHQPLDMMLIYVDEKGKEKAFELLYELRRKRLRVDIDHSSRSLKSQMRRADRLQSKSVVVLGETEVQEQKAAIKLLSSGETKTATLDGESIAAAALSLF